MDPRDHEVAPRTLNGMFFCGQPGCHYEIVWNINKWEHAVEEAQAVVCEDMEARIVQHNIDYEVDQNARCALEMAVASLGRMNFRDDTVIEVADMYFDWLQKKTGRVVLEVKEEQ